MKHNFEYLKYIEERDAIKILDLRHMLIDYVILLFFVSSSSRITTYSFLIFSINARLSVYSLKMLYTGCHLRTFAIYGVITLKHVYKVILFFP